MNLTRPAAIKVTNTDLIKNLMSNKKELENLEKEIFKKNRQRLVRFNSRISSRRPFTPGTPEVHISRELITSKEMKIPKHILLEECGLSDVFTSTGDGPMSILIRKITRPLKSYQDKTNIITIPTVKVVEPRSFTRCNTPLRRKKRPSLKTEDSRLKTYKLNKWCFTPL
ncbi:hypothetical protein SteCoe_29334 [Stentor coeruleus]|uniref:Uncharacterized protein n=1 Tax=Stentor coeruleus TaxID=5963 RepID=A0A1R2B6F9_9CILI|nr:hypothetical protein SteCoe_29334 [Stentor coeruleus]